MPPGSHSPTHTPGPEHLRISRNSRCLIHTLVRCDLCWLIIVAALVPALRHAVYAARTLSLLIPRFLGTKACIGDN